MWVRSKHDVGKMCRDDVPIEKIKSRIKRERKAGIDMGCVLEKSNYYPDPPLILAIEAVRNDVVVMLLEEGANPNAVSISGYTALETATTLENIPVIKALLHHGANVNGFLTFAATPLIIATYRNNTEIVKLLLNKGADASKRDMHGQTALLIARNCGFTDIVEMLCPPPSLIG